MSTGTIKPIKLSNLKLGYIVWHDLVKDQDDLPVCPYKKDVCINEYNVNYNESEPQMITQYMSDKLLLVLPVVGLSMGKQKTETKLGHYIKYSDGRCEWRAEVGGMTKTPYAWAEMPKYELE